MARVDESPEDRDRASLVLTGFEDCKCGAILEVLYVCPPGVFDAEDLDDAPTAPVTCPSCGRKWTSTYSGWTFHTEAG